VVVDLSELAFADPSLMLDLAVLARRLRAFGGGIQLRGAQPHVRMLIEIAGLHRIDGVLVEGPSAAAA